jgi:hypothetical protein
MQVSGTVQVVDLGSGTPQNGTAYLPFAADSVWRLGIAQTATFAASNDPRNVAIHNTGSDGSGLVWVNSAQDSHPISFATSSDPQATMTDTNTSQTWQENIPGTARIASGSDKHMHIIRPDGLYIQEHFETARLSSTNYTCQRRAEVSLAGSGIGPQNGTRAYGGAALGGLIRGWEVDPSNPSYTGRIRHALAISLRPSQLYMDTGNWSGQSGYYTSGLLDTTKYPGWPAGTLANGFMKQTGYVWPASEQDANSPSTYSGVIPMGAYFAIPPDVNLLSLGLQTPEGLMLATAARDYGCYVTDNAGAQAFYCEDDAGPAAAFANAVVGGASASAHDPRVIFNALRLVTNNTSSTPNGGSLSTSRRG